MARADAASEAAPQAGGGRVARLDIHVSEIRQFFNSMDAAPFRERDLDPNAEQFIVEWGRETRTDAPLEPKLTPTVVEAPVTVPPPAPGHGTVFALIGRSRCDRHNVLGTCRDPRRGSVHFQSIEDPR